MCGFVLGGAVIGAMWERLGGRGMGVVDGSAGGKWAGTGRKSWEEWEGNEDKNKEDEKYSRVGYSNDEGESGARL